MAVPQFEASIWLFVLFEQQTMKTEQFERLEHLPARFCTTHRWLDRFALRLFWQTGDLEGLKRVAEESAAQSAESSRRKKFSIV